MTEYSTGDGTFKVGVPDDAQAVVASTNLLLSALVATRNFPVATSVIISILVNFTKDYVKDEATEAFFNALFKDCKDTLAAYKLSLEGVQGGSQPN